MQKLFYALVLAALAAMPGFARAADEPDYGLAYVLATASYCAYSARKSDADFGRARAVKCLDRAAEADSRLSELNVGSGDVETYVGDDAKDAYLLIKGVKSVILAFRGTITPPLSLQAAGLIEAVKRAALEDQEKVKGELKVFVSDWFNNGLVLINPLHRHGGFDKSWQALKAHLDLDCRAQSAPVNCSQFKAFLATPSSTGAARSLFITGHSKGGALATLAALDPLRDAPKPVVYVFAAAKSLSRQGAQEAGTPGRDIWRFEQDGDPVPSVPVDDSAIPFANLGWKIGRFFGLKEQPFYFHVGRRILFLENGNREVRPDPNGGEDPPGDAVRLTTTFGSAAKEWLTALLQLQDVSALVSQWMFANEKACRRLVDRHFQVFSSVQKLVWANDYQAVPGPDFFRTGFSDSSGEILWGYPQWCDLLKQQP